MTEDEWKVVEDMMDEFVLLGSSAAAITVIDLVLAGAILFPIILVPVGIAFKSDVNGGDYGKAVYDGLISITLNCI